MRATDKNGSLIAGAADYEFTARLWSCPLGRTLGQNLSEPASRFLDRVLAEGDAPTDPLPAPFTTSVVRDRLQAGRSTVSGFLAELEAKDYLEYAETARSGRGRPPKAWRPTDRADDGGNVLPPCRMVFRDPPSGGVSAEMAWRLKRQPATGSATAAGQSGANSKKVLLRGRPDFSRR